MGQAAAQAGVADWLAQQWGADVELLIDLRDGRDVFVEGRVTQATCAASLQLDERGAVARALSFTCELVEPPAALDENERPALLPLIERYFLALNGGEFAAAAACFSDDCLYVHPPYRPGQPQAEFRGRAELLALWPGRRGPSSFETSVERCVQSANHAFIEGVAAGGSFLSSAVLDEQGLVQRYVAFYTPERVPRIAR